MIGITVFFWLLSNLLRFFFSFAQPAVVITRTGIFEAMGQSFKLIVSYWGRVMFFVAAAACHPHPRPAQYGHRPPHAASGGGRGSGAGQFLLPLLTYTIAGLIGTRSYSRQATSSATSTCSRKPYGPSRTSS